MTLGWRSTTLGLAEKHCPRALDFYEAGAPYDRSVFHVGTAAHAVLEDIGRESAKRGTYIANDAEVEAIAAATCAELIERGRDFEGDGEPPLPSAEVWRGRDLALAYQRDFPMSPHAEYEVGVAVSRDWHLCPYGAEAWLRCRIDSRATVLPNELDAEDDGLAGPILEITDYKSSWAAGEDELRSLQRKIQAVLGWKKWGRNHDALRLRIVNFRAKKVYSLDIYPHETEGAAVLARWRRDIEIEIAARERQKGEDGRRPASPGPQCVGCPYLGQCEAARAYLGTVYRDSSPEEFARTYAVAGAFQDAAEGPLRAATAHEPLELDGKIIGTVPKTQQTLTRDAHEKLAAVYLRKTHPRDLETLKAALPGLLIHLGIGVTHAENLLKRLYNEGDEERDIRARELASITTTKPTRKFGIHPKEEKS